MKYTLGGDRLGSGQKMKGSMHNYFRSTHNLSEKFISSMASGALYPCLCKIATRGDSFDINIAADCRTIPTLGPLFGRFKLQIDVFQVPIRLYQGILHNNPLAIGLQMDKVYLPTIMVKGAYDTEKGEKGVQFNNSCLLKYLGMSGLGRQTNIAEGDTIGFIARRINAIPVLAYYDIFKNYYANKQEEQAYVLSGEATDDFYGRIDTVNGAKNVATEANPAKASLNLNTPYTLEVIIEGEGLLTENIYMHWYNTTTGLDGDNDIASLVEENYILLEENTKKKIVMKISSNLFVDTTQGMPSTQNFQFYFEIYENTPVGRQKVLSILPFDLKNIDDMRYDLLCNNQLGVKYQIGQYGGAGHEAYMPYSTLTETFYDENGNDRTNNELPLNGLVLKTYQNDIYNNWLNTDWIEGENGINELSKVSVTDGAFSMDALNFAQKLYNMLNRIAVAGATYEDWQDAVYEQVKRRHIESPIFCGGLSQEVVFDEVVQTAPTSDEQPLGTLGGRGRLADKYKGGKLHIKCDEPCFIIGIASLTPRQVYTQGNEFYMTDVETINDLHKPAMDGIGFQDLIGERMAWWDTGIINNNGQMSSPIRTKIGKLPAWIEYMTSVDKAYGDFAAEYGKGYMVLNRNYEQDEETGGIKDATTYIDPQKYNYAFAYDALDSQNFWVQINFDIKARRLMSARLIPNV